MFSADGTQCVWSPSCLVWNYIRVRKVSTYGGGAGRPKLSPIFSDSWADRNLWMRASSDLRGDAMATYYIDYDSGLDLNVGTSKVAPWKRCPGMKGWAGKYVHAAGDRFAFKGGVTWPFAALPLKIANGGAAGNVDAYGGLDTAWYAGKAWSQPVLDAQMLSGEYGHVVCESGHPSHLKIHNLHLKNSGDAVTGTHTGPAGSAVLTDSTKAWTANRYAKFSVYNQTDKSHGTVTASTPDTVTAVLAGGIRNDWNPGDVYMVTSGTGNTLSMGGSDIEICYNTIEPHSVEAISYAAGGGNRSHVLIHHNSISHAGRFIIYGYPASLLDDVQVYGNRMEGNADFLAGYHQDGLMIGQPVAPSRAGALRDPHQVLRQPFLRELGRDGHVFLLLQHELDGNLQ